MQQGFVERVESRLKELGLTPRSASLEVSTNPDLFRNVLRFGDDANPKQKTLALMAEALQWSVEDLTQVAAPRPTEVSPANVPYPDRISMTRDVPVFGTVAGSELGKGAFQMTADVVEYVRRPPGLATVKDAYALYVEGESMSPKFEPGELVYVHPHRKVVSGDYVVVQEPDTDNGELRGFIKQYVRQTTKLLQTQQFNPASKIDFVIRPGLKWHRVMSLSDLMGF